MALPLRCYFCVKQKNGRDCGTSCPTMHIPGDSTAFVDIVSRFGPTVPQDLSGKAIKHVSLASDPPTVFTPLEVRQIVDRVLASLSREAQLWTMSIANGVFTPKSWGALRPAIDDSLQESALCPEHPDHDCPCKPSSIISKRGFLGIRKYHDLRRLIHQKQGELSVKDMDLVLLWESCGWVRLPRTGPLNDEDNVVHEEVDEEVVPGVDEEVDEQVVHVVPNVDVVGGTELIDANNKLLQEIRQLIGVELDSLKNDLLREFESQNKNILIGPEGRRDEHVRLKDLNKLLEAEINRMITENQVQNQVQEQVDNQVNDEVQLENQANDEFIAENQVNDEVKQVYQIGENQVNDEVQNQANDEVIGENQVNDEVKQVHQIGENQVNDEVQLENQANDEVIGENQVNDEVKQVHQIGENQMNDEVQPENQANDEVIAENQV